MHEGAIAESIVDILKQVKERNGLKRIVKVRLKIGKMSGIMIDALMFALEALRTEEDVIFGTSFEVIETNIRAKCNLCDRIYEYKDVSEVVMICDQCGMPLDIIEGKEMEIIDVEGEL